MEFVKINPFLFYSQQKTNFRSKLSVNEGKCVLNLLA